MPALSVNNWIIIQQRIISTASTFARNWTDYRNGFGNVTLNGSFWMGNEKIYTLTEKDTRPYRLRIEMLSQVEGKWRSAEYSSFSIDDESLFYTLHVGTYAGDSGDSLQCAYPSTASYQNGMKFSTYDKDNDLSSTLSCSTAHGSGGWWFNACWDCCLTCDATNFAWFTNPVNDAILNVSRMMIKYV